MLTASPDCLADDVGRLLRPDEGGRVAVPAVDVVMDVADKGFDRLEGGATHRFTGEDSKPRLDHVEPGGAFRSEVEVNPRVSLEPGVYGGRGVGGGVVEDDVQITHGEGSSQRLQEAEEFLSGVTRSALPNHASARDFESGVEAGQAVPSIVVGLSCGKSRPERQHGLRPAERL